MLSNSDEKQCPYCGEKIKAIAVLCKHCKSTLPPIKNSEKPADKIWFYRIGGIEFGPVKTEDLLALSNRYDATRTIEIKTSENDNWQVIKSISQIKEYIEKNNPSSDDESDDVYFYRYGDGPKSGPFTYNEIMQMYQNKQISSSVRISENNSDKWDVITDYIIMDELDASKTSSTVRINNDFGFLLLAIPVIGTILIWILNSLNSLTSYVTLTIGISVVVTTLLIAIYETCLHESKKDAEWILLIGPFLMIWIYGYPAYFAGRVKYGFKPYTIPAIFVALSLLVTLAIADNLYATFPFLKNKDIELVKNGVLQVCPKSNLNAMANAFFRNPKWEAGKSESGQRFVNLTGEMNSNGKPVTTLIQFFLEGDGSFQVNALEINRTPESYLTLGRVLVKMCESAKELRIKN